MIALLRGTLLDKSLNRVIVDVNGVGYQVHIPLTTYYQIADAASATLHIHTHVREDALQLYGFHTSADREMFLLLLSISGIGPKVALNIISHMSSADLCAALQNEDAKLLATLPGIGKKTAERLVLELREKAARLAADTGTATTARPPTDADDDTLSALINLGYKEKQARMALSKIDVAADADMGTRLKAALKILSR